MVGSVDAAEPEVPPITAAAAIVIDRNSGFVLGVKNPDERRAMASTTKMMTALLAIERNGSQLDAMVGPISTNAAGFLGTTMNLYAGDRLSLRELLYGLMLPSGNDAAIAIAEWVSGNETSFVTLMNQRAQQLGLINTAYRNAHGTDPTVYGASCDPPYSSQTNCGHYSTARDLVTLARFAMNDPLFAQLVQTYSYTPSTWVDASDNPRTDTLYNDNLLLSSMPYPGADGVKTGNTPAAGFCLVASASQADETVMSVVLGCSSDDVRITESSQLLDYGFSQLPPGGFPLPKADFNSDGFTDYLLFNPNNRATAIWNLRGNIFLSGAYGPSLPAGWVPICVADINRNGHPDYILFNEGTRQTAIWYLNGSSFAGSAYGPTLPAGWTLIAATDFNGDSKPDYVLFNPTTRRTALWHLNGTVFTSGVYGPTLPSGWTLIDALDFNADNKSDFLLSKSSTRQTAIWHLNFAAFASSIYGPTLPAGWTLQGAADFNANAKPDYVLFQASTRRTALWYLNGGTFVGSAYGPTLATGYSLVSP
jgi:D-alanyl-D-alanine carboxypeptidase